MYIYRDISSDLVESSTVSGETRTHQLSETVLVPSSDVRVLLEKQCGKRQLNLESYCIDFGRRFLKFTLTLLKYQSYAFYLLGACRVSVAVLRALVHR